MYPYVYIGSIKLPAFLLSLAVGLLCAVLYIYLKAPERQVFIRNYFAFMVVLTIGFLAGKLTYHFLLLIAQLSKGNGLYSTFSLPLGNSIIGFLWSTPITVWGLAKLMQWKDWLMTMDELVFPLLLFQILGKTGCFLSGCCFGMPSDLPWAVEFSLSSIAPNHVALHPVQLYEVFLLTLTFIVLRLYEHKSEDRRGSITFFYYICYSLERLIVDFFRVDYSLFGTSLKVSQLISLGILILAISSVLRKRSKNRLPIRT